MIELYNKKGVYYLFSDEFDLKIDTNRRLYLRRHDEKNENIYIFSGIQLDYGMSREEKEIYLLEARKILVEQELRVESEYDSDSYNTSNETEGGGTNESMEK